uniref:Retrovirus-related Pol polyprotein from transposon TNT 1-94 n=1 Tax=Tanacetum cinerariifolium TaxID=118510 RepID=A0A6L2LX53_TANCI|nr:retrovirus-related Pol polyprotein from transposon TNT 1-94 [Tanacetum cinerariifolium]
MAQIEKVLLDLEESSTSAEETIVEVACYTSESESEPEFAASEYYDNFTNYGLFVNNDDDQEIFHDAIESAKIFHDAIESASENFIENHIDSQKDYDKSEVDHNDSEEKEHLVDKLIRKFNHKIAKCQKNFEKIDSPFQQTSSLKPYVTNVILEKFIIDLEDEVVSLLEKEEANLKTIESLKSKSFESSENAISKSENQSENDCHVVEKECDKVENSMVIAHGLFKLSVSQSVSPISMSKTSCDSNNVESKLKRKRRKRKSLKQNDKQVNNDVLHANRDFAYFSYLDTFSSVRRHKNSNVIWKKKGSSNTSNVDLTSVSRSELNKNVKRYSRKDLLSCNNSHLRETNSAYFCNDALNISCNSRMCDLFDENNLFIFDDESVKISPVSKMPFRKKPRDSMNVLSKSNLNKSLPRNVHRWLPKMQPLDEHIAKRIPRVKRQIDKISKTPNSSGPIYKWVPKHMMGNRALLTNFMEKFLGTVRFGNNDFAVIAGYEDVVIGSLTIKKVYYVEGLSKIKFEKDHLRSAYEHGKIHWKHHKSKTTFASNKPLYLLHMDLCGPMRVESLNGKRYVLVVVDDYSRYIWVFFLHSMDEASEVIISFIKKTQVNLQLQVHRVRTDNGTEFKNKTLAKFFDEVGITQQFFAARMPQQNGVVERRNQTLVEAARTMLTFADLPSFLWAEAIAMDYFTQNHLIIHKRFDKTPYELMNKKKPNIKFFRVFGCRWYLLNDYEDVGKLKAKRDIRVFVGYSKSVAFRIYNKQSRKIYESMNVNFDEISKMASKQFSLEPGLSNLNQRNMKSSTTNVEISINEEVFHVVSESFQGESCSSSLNDDVQQSPEEVILPQTNTQSISNNMIPNVVEVSTLNNVFNERLEDAYFDISTSFHDPSNVNTFYQPYHHEKK